MNHQFYRPFVVILTVLALTALTATVATASLLAQPPDAFDSGLSWLSLFIQIPLVGIFIWFTLQLLKLNREERVSRDSEWRSFLANREVAIQTWLTAENIRMASIVDTANNINVANIAAINRNTEQIAKQTAVILCNFAASTANGKPLDYKDIMNLLSEQLGERN